MKTFLLRVLFFLLPIISIIVLMEVLLRNIPNDYYYKSNFLFNNSNKIEKLVLGNSHAYYGVNPDFIDGNAFNASHISQSINLDLKIITKYDKNWNQLEHIIIPIDYLTLFSRLSNGVEYWRLKNYNLYYNMQLSNKLSDNSELLSVNFKSNLIRIGSYYVLNKIPITCSKSGFGYKEGSLRDLIETGETAAIRHTAQDLSKLKESLEILNELIEFASKNEIKIVFYSSPSFSSYVSNLDKDQLNITIDEISKLAKKHSNCTYVNLLESPEFEESDYRDADHLNPKGAKKLSLILNDLIQNNSMN